MHVLPLTLACLVLPLTYGPDLGSAPEGADDGQSRWGGKTYEVHEWGTFTGVQGSNGVALEGLLHDPFGLPPFVYDIVSERGLTGITPKMETPVVYFYAPEEWQVQVRVDFPRGLITQWYPAPTKANLHGENGYSKPSPAAFAPAFGGTLENGFIEWGRLGELVVSAPGAESNLPDVHADDPWIFSRQVAANDLRVENWNYWTEETQKPRAEEERFLFYRGLGNFDLPVVAKVSRETRMKGSCELSFTLENRTPEEQLEQLFLVYVDGEEAGFLALPDLDERLSYENLDVPLAPLAKTSEALVDALASGLAETGLFTDEAYAMARTWQHSWFEDQGMRILCVLPDELVERELPLAVTPQSPGFLQQANGMVPKPSPPPEVIARTFVARIEMLSPEREEGILETLRDMTDGDEAAQTAAADEIAAWGRYSVPFLQRAAALTARESISTN